MAQGKHRRRANHEAHGQQNRRPPHVGEPVVGEEQPAGFFQENLQGAHDRRIYHAQTYQQGRGESRWSCILRGRIRSDGGEIPFFKIFEISDFFYIFNNQNRLNILENDVRVFVEKHFHPKLKIEICLCSGIW